MPLLQHLAHTGLNLKRGLRINGERTKTRILKGQERYQQIPQDLMPWPAGIGKDAPISSPSEQSK